VPPPLDELGRPSGGPLNRRAEMWMKSKGWLELEGGVQVPDSDSLQADACGPSYRYDALTRIVLESGGHAPARRAEPGRMGRGRLDVRAAGGAEQFQSEARLSAERAGVRRD
jgi:hypothetical protein